MKLLSWNMAHRKESWYHLVDTDADIALLQEASAPPRDIAARIEVDEEPWRTDAADAVRPWRTAVVRLSQRVDVEWLKPKPIEQAAGGELAVSRPGTLAAAEIRDSSGARLIVVSMYGLWERPHRSTKSRWIYADASVHRLISDLSSLIGQQGGHRIIAAGDLNILHGYGEEGSRYWAGRYQTVFQRMASLGLPFLGPQSPNGRRADPWPRELPRDSRNVPTYHTTHMTPAQATRQLDFVFASGGLAERLQVTALNDPFEWGPSDHSRVMIEIR